MPKQEPSMTDLERRTFKVLLSAHQRHFPAKDADYAVLVILAKAAVSALTKGTASGRRLSTTERRIPDPGSSPNRIRYLARQIEGSFHTMPNGWVPADERNTSG